jgi:hypothetical protein
MPIASPHNTPHRERAPLSAAPAMFHGRCSLCACAFRRRERCAKEGSPCVGQRLQRRRSTCMRALFDVLQIVNSRRRCRGPPSSDAGRGDKGPASQSQSPHRLGARHSTITRCLAHVSCSQANLFRWLATRHRLRAARRMRPCCAQTVALSPACAWRARPWGNRIHRWVSPSILDAPHELP